MSSKSEQDQNSDQPKRIGAGTRLRNYFLTGLVIAAPVSITIYLTWSFITFVDDWVKPWLPPIYNPDNYLPFSVPGVGLIVAIAMIILLGFFTANLVGRTMVSYGELMLDGMPLVRSVYRTLKQIFETVFSERSNTFQHAGLIEYPRKGLWAIVFISTETTGEIADKIVHDNELMSVFLPTTPNPTSGFLLFVPRQDITLLEMSVEEAAKLVISAGLVTPEYQTKAQKIAEEAGLLNKKTGEEKTGEKTEKADA